VTAYQYDKNAGLITKMTRLPLNNEVVEEYDRRDILRQSMSEVGRLMHMALLTCTS
jgi:hypothetical protein